METPTGIPACKSRNCIMADAANVDLKGCSENFYRKVTGSTLQPVLDTLEHVVNETSTWLEITTLLIEGYNDSSAELESLSKWIAERLHQDIPVHVTTFYPDWKMRDVPPTFKATVKRAREIAIANGIRHVYTGNVDDEEGDATFCHSCGLKLIQRNWHAVDEYLLRPDGECPNCETRCPGHFASAPGHRGCQRRTVSIAD